jgi:hypothetical protein
MTHQPAPPCLPAAVRDAVAPVAPLGVWLRDLGLTGAGASRRCLLAIGDHITSEEDTNGAALIWAIVARAASLHGVDAAQLAQRYDRAKQQRSRQAASVSGRLGLQFDLAVPCTELLPGEEGVCAMPHMAANRNQRRPSCCSRHGNRSSMCAASSTQARWPEKACIHAYARTALARCAQLGCAGGHASK